MGNDETRMCVACGRSVPASHDRAGPWPECPSPDACTFDLTDREAWEYWREKAHRERARAEKAEAAGLTANDLYYLRAIDRRLREFADALDGLDALTIGGEAFADERDWLDCFIARAALRNEGGDDGQTG